MAGQGVVPLKIALVQHRLRRNDGQGRVNLEIVLKALERGHHVTLLCEWIEPELRDHPRVAWVRIPCPNQFSNLVGGAISSVYANRWLSKHHRELDVILANGATTTYPVDVCACHMVHSAWIKSSAHPCKQPGLGNLYQGLYTRFNAYRELQAYRTARSVVAVSHKVKRELIAAGIPGEKIEVIVNGVNLQEFRPGPEDRAAIGLPCDVPLGLFVGGLKIPLKNPDTILHAMTQVPDIHVAFAGAAEGSPFPLLADDLGVTDRAHFLGFRRDIPALMRASDFLIFPSRYEAGTLVVLEALASGLPVITAATVGNSEFVTPECGIVQDDPNDVAALAQNMVSMMKNAKDTLKRARMSQAACHSVADLTWDNMADRYLNKAESLAGHSPLPTGNPVVSG